VQNSGIEYASNVIDECGSVPQDGIVVEGVGEQATAEAARVSRVEARPVVLRHGQRLVDDGHVEPSTTRRSVDELGALVVMHARAVCRHDDRLIGDL